jgi:hypothetical protein
MLLAVAVEPSGDVACSRRCIQRATNGKRRLEGALMLTGDSMDEAKAVALRAVESAVEAVARVAAARLETVEIHQSTVVKPIFTVAPPSSPQVTLPSTV